MFNIRRECDPMKRITRIVAITLGAIGLLTVSVTAGPSGIVTQTFSFATASTDWTNSLAIQQINLIGTLNSVTIIETIDWSTYLAGTNTDSVANVKVTKDQAEVQIYDSITGPSTFLIDQSIGYNNNGGVTLLPNTGHVFGNYFSTNSFTYSYGLGQTAAFVGSGVLPLQVYTYTGNNLSSSGGGKFVNIQNTAANLEVQVLYNYNGNIIVPSVPEPSAGILFGIGGVICCIWGWRRKATSSVI